MLKWLFKLTLFIPLFISTNSFSQVINVETKRFLNDSNGWIGNADGSFSIVQNIDQVISLATTARLQYVHNRHRVLFLQDLGLVKAASTNYVNTGYQHIRYGYKVVDRITLEAFLQGQYNPVLKLNFRALAGLGPRFKLIKATNFRLYVATIYMFEHDEVNDTPSRIDEHRFSPYLTMTIVFFKGMELSTTLFYQPKVTDFRDYRIANDLVLEIGINKYLSFKCSYNLLYDTRQPTGVPAMVYGLKNSISFRF